jgi:hypothetical protein
MLVSLQCTASQCWHAADNTSCPAAPPLPPQALAARRHSVYTVFVRVPIGVIHGLAAAPLGLGDDEKEDDEDDRGDAGQQQVRLSGPSGTGIFAKDLGQDQRTVIVGG